MYSRRALNMNLPWLWKSYVSLSALNLLNSLIWILRAEKKDMYCPAFSVEYVEFPYFAFKSRKKRHVSPNGVESVEQRLLRAEKKRHV